MVTHKETRAAGLLGILTAVLLTGSLVFVQAGPTSSHPNAVLAWVGEHGIEMKASALLWLLAMLSLVVFAVRIREALWSSIIDRGWVTVLFVQGAGVFATIAVVAAALTWGLADLVQADAVGAELAGTLWGLQQAILRFATWGFTVPLVVVGAVLYRHSLLGQICAVAAVVVAAGLLVPLTWQPALYAFCAWLFIAGVALLVGARSEVRHPELVG